MRTSSSGSCNSSNRERSNSCASTCSSGSSVSVGGSQTSNLPTCRIFTVCDIVKTGYMHIKRPPTSGSIKIRLKETFWYFLEQTWQKRFFVLRDQSYQRGSARLEMYGSESAWHEDRPPADDCLCVDLHTVAHITEYSDSRSYPHAFTLARTGHGPLVLGAESEYDLKEWMVAIQVLSDKVKSTHTGNSTFLEPGGWGDPEGSPNRRPSCPPRLTSWSSAQQLHSSLELVVTNSSLRTGPKISEPKENSKNVTRLLKLPNTAAACSNCLVTVELTEDSGRVQLDGDYYMIVLRDEIFLQRPGTLGEVATWPLSHIIKLKTEDTSDGSNIVTLEASSLCGKHAGRYLFKTAYGREIIQKVKDTMSRQASKQPSGDEELERLRVKPIARAPSSPDLLNRCSPPHLLARAPSDTPPDVIPQSSRTIRVRSAAHLHSNSSTTTRTAQTTVRKTYSLDIPIGCPNDDSPCDVIQPETSLSVMAGPARDFKRLSLDAPHLEEPELPDDIPVVAPPQIPDMMQGRVYDVPPEIPSRDRKPSSSSGKMHSYLHLVDEGHKKVPSTPEKPRPVIDSAKGSSPNNPKKKLSKLPPLPPSALDRTSPPKSSAIDIPPSLPRRRSSCSPPPPPPRPQHTLGSNSSPVW